MTASGLSSHLGAGTSAPQRDAARVASQGVGESLPESDDPATEIRFEAASFRDPAGGVFYAGDRVFRYFTEDGAAEFRKVQASGLLTELEGRRAIVATTTLEPAEARSLERRIPGAALVVEVERIPFISYPYEWPFEMLKAAAAQHLETLQAALDRGFILKDATPYNSQFVGAAPRLIDVASFEPYSAPRPWAGYAQFCRTFLNPLFLESFTGVPYQAWLRSSIAGIDPADLRALLPLRQKLRKDVFVHVVLQSWLDARMRNTVDQSSARELSAGTSDASLRKLLTKLERTVARIKRRTRGRSHWVDYEADCHYEDEATAAKQSFVESVLASAHPAVVWDLGSNLGQYSLIAARHARYVVSIDSDVQAVSGLYERVRGKHDNVLPLYVDLANPSPDQGWAHQERKSLASRGPADFVLCLALMHHLVISSGVPVARFVEWLASIARAGIVEFVPLTDPMAQALLRTRDGAPPQYDEATFRHALEGAFAIERVERLPNSQRSLYVFSAR